jgi:hypothetical protein
MTTPIEGTAMNNTMDRSDERRRLNEARSALYDRARADASRLRDEAFTELVVGADAFVRDAAQRAVRAANRLAARLRQHGKRRAFEA